MTSWIQLLLEFRRDWTRHETYEAAGAVVVATGEAMQWVSRTPESIQDDGFKKLNGAK